MSFEPDNEQSEQQNIDKLDLILKELRLITLLLAQGQNENADSLREGIQDAN
jgi:hypothetical protein